MRYVNDLIFMLKLAILGVSVALAIKCINNNRKFKKNKGGNINESRNSKIEKFFK